MEDSDLSLKKSDINYQTTPVQNKSGGLRCFIMLVLLGFTLLTSGVIQLVTNAQQTRIVAKLKCQLGLPTKCKSQEIKSKFNQGERVWIELKYLNAQLYEAQAIFDQSVPCTNREYNKKVDIFGNFLNPDSRVIPCGMHATCYPQGAMRIYDSDEKQIQLIQEGLSIFQYAQQPVEGAWADTRASTYKSWIETNLNWQPHYLWGYMDLLQRLSSFHIEMDINNTPQEQPQISILMTNNVSKGGYNLEKSIVDMTFSLVIFFGASVAYYLERKGSQNISASSMHTVHQNQ